MVTNLIILQAFYDLPNNSDIGVKIIGKLDFTPFLEGVKKKHNWEDEEAFDRVFVSNNPNLVLNCYGASGACLQLSFVSENRRKIRFIVTS